MEIILAVFWEKLDNNFEKFLDLSWGKQHERSHRRRAGCGRQDHPIGQGQECQPADRQVRGEQFFTFYLRNN